MLVRKVRFATEEYNLNPATISNTRIHVTNFDVNKEQPQLNSYHVYNYLLFKGSV